MLQYLIYKRYKDDRMFKQIPGFENYEINKDGVIRNVKTGNIKAPHRGGSNVRLYADDAKEVSRKIAKLVDLAFPELVEGVALPNLSRYRIRDNGSVYSMYEAKVIAPATTHDGYLSVSLTLDSTDKPTSFLVHRLVGEAFINKQESRSFINHIDGDKKNNNVSNLEWCTHIENIHHAYATGLLAPKDIACAVSADGVNWKHYTSFKEAGKELTVPHQQLNNAARLNRKLVTDSTFVPYRTKGVICVHKDTLVAVGSVVTDKVKPRNKTDKYIVSSDGISWTELESQKDVTTLIYNSTGKLGWPRTINSTAKANSEELCKTYHGYYIRYA